MRLSVGIATWNRCELLRRTLESLCSLRVPDDAEWQLLVCDNNSTDQTRTVVDSFADRLPVRYLLETRQGKSHALNRLLGEATSPWLVLTDDDVQVDADWLTEYVSAIGRYPSAVCLGGPVSAWVPRSLRCRQAFLIREYPGTFALLPLDRDAPMKPPHVTAFGVNMALRLDAVPDGGFNTRLGPLGEGRVSGEEVDLIERMVQQGEAWLVTGPKVRHYVDPRRLRMRWFWSRQMAVGREWVVHRGAPARGRFGVPWWAWRELARRVGRAAMRWRPWPSRAYYQAMAETAQYLGYLRGPHDG